MFQKLVFLAILSCLMFLFMVNVPLSGSVIGCVVTHFWVPTKNKNKKPKEIRKIIRGGSAQEESEKN